MGDALESMGLNHHFSWKNLTARMPDVSLAVVATKGDFKNGGKV